MDPRSAQEDLAFLRSVVERTQRRIDPHAFHFVHWGAIVLVWYPVDNALARSGADGRWRAGLGIASLLAGIVLSWLGEVRLARRRDLPPEDTFVSRQVNRIVAGTIWPAALLSALGPALHLFDGERVPLVWGFAYAVLAYMTGVVYSAEFRWGGIAIFAGTLAAFALPAVQGFILGPAMGLGMIVPGIIATRRVQAQRSVLGAALE